MWAAKMIEVDINLAPKEQEIILVKETMRRTETKVNVRRGAQT
jgi:hypothetical protein